jgi:hypothetical protein
MQFTLYVTDLQFILHLLYLFITIYNIVQKHKIFGISLFSYICIDFNKKNV